jgi:hypothetical protein
VASYTKLVQGAGAALRRMQEEMMAAGKVPYPDAPGALQLYHGSPHAFDKFDFEGNLLRGEGAMAYGPGGYMTGNRPLAEHYATGLHARHSGGGGGGLASPFGSLEKPVYNMGSLNKYFIDELGDRQMRMPDGRLVTAGPGQLARSKYALSMDSSLDPWSGSVFAKTNSNKYGISGTTEFAPGQQKAATRGPTFYNQATRRMEYLDGPGPGANNPHGTLSGMLAEDKNATLRYLQYKEAQRLMEAGFIDLGQGATRGQSTLADAKAGSGWKHYLDTVDELDPSIHNNLSPIARKRIMGTITGRDEPDWRLTPQNSDWAMRLGEDLNNRLDPHANINMRVDRPRRPPASPGEGKAPWLYTADYGAGPNDMLLYDAPFKDQAPRVQGALNDLFSNGIQHSRLLDQTTSKLQPQAMGSDIVHSLPKDLDGMQMLKEAGVPATAYLRAGPRKGGLGLGFDPSDFNFVIHNQDLLDNVRRERLK